MKENSFGDYSKSRVSDIPVDLVSDIYKKYQSTILNFPNQAVYVYSFKENKMIYAQGWLDVLGYRDDEINMLSFMKCTAPRYLDFSLELNDKALLFMNGKTKELEKYGFTLQLEKIHKDGFFVPLFSRVSVYKSNNGHIEEIIGISQVIKTLKLGKIMQFSAYGPESSNFEETLNKQLFYTNVISGKEKEALSLAALGYAFKEIANTLSVSQSAIEKRIFPLYKRFNVKSLAHLVSFAHKNNILP